MSNLDKNQMEVWMQGPIASIPAILQPVAHALLQVDEDVQNLIKEDLQAYLWIKPFEMASIAFHIQHIAGVVDRMVTYSKEESLTEDQFEYLKTEGIQNSNLNVELLKNQLTLVIQDTLNYLKTINPDSLTEERYLGRKRIPTTQIGLLFHAAEHAQRHYGQLLVTSKVIKELFLNGSIH